MKYYAVAVQHQGWLCSKVFPTYTAAANAFRTLWKAGSRDISLVITDEGMNVIETITNILELEAFDFFE